LVVDSLRTFGHTLLRVFLGFVMDVSIVEDWRIIFIGKAGSLGRVIATIA
jgi:hypothetical protein